MSGDQREKLIKFLSASYLRLISAVSKGVSYVSIR
jgi:hypothetical protein